RKARKVFICSTFGLFTNRLQKFDEYYGNGLIDRILTTNLIYQTPELLSRPYYIDVDMSKYIALIIDNLNHDASLSELLNPTVRINRLLEKYRAGIR
ncbi:ribose-phosphate pyrophosphokinase, partial [[Clostridium] symbiosum]|nr:ribose-phosphate pyrophosphokinase [[Clostridium] symbiosum]